MSYPARNYPETEHKDYDAYGNPKIAVQHQQPVAMQSMSLDAGLSRDEDGKRAWKNGLFDIANDLPTCTSRPITYPHWTETDLP